MNTLLEAAKQVLYAPAPPMESVIWVRVNAEDFRALEKAVKAYCDHCHGTGNRIPGFVNLSDPCECRKKDL